jgi:hypothetical protein
MMISHGGQSRRILGLLTILGKSSKTKTPLKLLWYAYRLAPIKNKGTNV